MTSLSERPSPHPLLAGREQSVGALADTVRLLAELTMTSGAPPAVLDDVVTDMRAAAQRLSSYVPAERPPRFFRPPDDPKANAVALNDAMPFDLVIGRYNPLAPPVEIEMRPPKALGRALFSTAFEGAPGWVHGAAIAAAFDVVLTAANRLEDVAGPTVKLSMRFRRPTLLAVEARFESWIEEIRGGRVTSRGHLLQNDRVTVEAEGEFSVLEAEAVRAWTIDGTA